jgi:hypothetical protein
LIFRKKKKTTEKRKYEFASKKASSRKERLGNERFLFNVMEIVNSHSKYGK